MSTRRPPVSQSSKPLRFAPWVRGPEWDTHRFAQPGWLLLPLRAFLGVTFTFASLQKLSNPDFFRAGSPASVQQQMTLLAGTSPIGPLVRLSLHAGVLTGLLIALGELAVGVGILLGLKARLAAAGGALLALTFFLTVSWNTSPYYYGADIVFLFAWTPFIAVGAAGVLSVDGWLVERARLTATPRRRAGAVPVAPEELARRRERRAILTAGAATALLGGMTAIAGRLGGGGAAGAQPGLLPSKPGPRTTPPHHARHQPSNPTGPQRTPHGTEVGPVSAVPVGQAARFTDPASGQPAYLVCLAKGQFAAFSAVCTHAGCTVEYAASNKEFFCPCHGGTYSARTGQVLGGPPPAPLPPIRVLVADGKLYVD